MRMGSITTDIVSDGLVLNMDAANRASYVSNNLETFDTTDTSVSGSLVNDTTFNTSPLSWAFDGTDDYITLSSAANFRPTDAELNSAGLTFLVWFKTNDNTAVQGLFCTDGVNQGTYYGLEGFWNGGTSKFGMAKMDGTGAGSADRSTALTTAVTVNNDQWYNVAFNYVNSNKSNFVIYINGVAQSMTTSGTGGNVGYSSSAQAAIGAMRTFDLNGNIANVQVYNRTLSASEVLHNYNALKSRFGL